jgi:hypothetical protein
MKTSRFNGLCNLRWQDEEAVENGLSAIGRDVCTGLKPGVNEKSTGLSLPAMAKRRLSPGMTAGESLIFLESAARTGCG